MFTWKAENQELTNNHRYLGKDIVFYVEDETSLEDQIKFLDEMNNGALSYSMELVKKFNEDKKSLPKDDYGYVKTNSLKAWIRRNVDQKKLHVDNDWHYGEFRIAGQDLDITLGDKFNNELINMLFHKQLMRCLCEEEKWFKEHDPLEVKKTKIRNYMQKYHTTFNYHLVFSSKNGIEVVPDDDTFDGLPITDKQCNEILDKYEMVDSLIAELSK